MPKIPDNRHINLPPPVVHIVLIPNGPKQPLINPNITILTRLILQHRHNLKQPKLTVLHFKIRS